MRTHQRIGLLSGCLALATLYLPQCLGIATGWPTRPRLTGVDATHRVISAKLQAAAILARGDRTDGAGPNRAPEVGAYMGGQ